MKYLFFDIECANCFNGSSKICEFGYVIADDGFNVIEKKEILVNPCSSFDSYAIKNILHFKKSDYRSAPDFRSYYEEIRSLLLSEGVLVFGHAVANDARFLKDECKRYKLDYIDFTFVDVGIIYKKLFELKEIASLKKMCEELGISDTENLHNALFDAERTMLVIKAICEKTNRSVADLIKKCPEAKGRFDLTEKPVNKKRKKKKRVKNEKTTEKSAV